MPETMLSSLRRTLGRVIAGKPSAPPPRYQRKHTSKPVRVPVQEAIGDGPGPNWLGNIVPNYDQFDGTPDFWLGSGNVEQVSPYLNKTLHGDYLPVYLTWYGLKVQRDLSRLLLVQNEYAIGAVQNVINYICGKGYQHKLVPKNDKDNPETKFLCALGQIWIDAFMAHNRWSEREQESVMRCYRDGETFMRFFHVGQGRTECRFVEPEWVMSPADSDWDSYGIVNQVGDIEDILGYWIYTYPPFMKLEYVDAREVIHIKVNTDSTSKRGLPTFYPVRKNLQRAEKLLRNMSVIAQVQSSFAAIRTHKQYSVAAIQQQQQANADLNWNDPYSGQQQFGIGLNPGQIVDSFENVSWDFPSANVNAGNLVAILQAELQAAAQRVNFPAFMFSGDVSGSNMASTFIAESPFVRRMECEQAFYARRFGDGGMNKVKCSGAMWRVLANAVDYGGLPKEVLTDCELIVEGPTLIVRDKGQETQRAAMLNQAGELSFGTWAKWEGLDYEQEEKQWQQEQIKKTLFQTKLQEIQAESQMKIQQQQMQMQAAAQQQAQLQAIQQQSAAVPPTQGNTPPNAGAPGAAVGGAPGVLGAPGAVGQPPVNLQQRDLLQTPRTDSGFISRMGGNMRDLVGLESVEEAQQLAAVPEVAELQKLMGV